MQVLTLFGAGAGTALATGLGALPVFRLGRRPEALAIGTAYASDRSGLSLFVILAIAIQNIPEGTSVALPMEEAGYTHSKQFWAAVMTSSPQPFGAVLAFLLVEQINALLPVSF